MKNDFFINSEFTYFYVNDTPPERIGFDYNIKERKFK